MALALVGAILLGEVLLASALATGRLTVLLLAFAGAVGLALVFAFPLLAAAGMLVATASIFHAGWFSVGVGPLDTQLSEVLLAALLVVAVARPKARTWGGVPGAGLAVFLALVVFAGGFAVATGKVGPQECFGWGRVFGMFAFFYVVVRLFPDARSRRNLLLAAAVIGGVSGVFAVLAGAGAGIGTALQDPAQQFIRAQEGLGFLQRVRLPGLSLAYALFWYALVQVFEQVGGRRLAWLAILLAFTASLALSFNRNMWIGLCLGLMLMLVLGSPMTRRRLVATVAAAAALLLIVGTGVGFESTLSPLVERGASLLEPKDLSAESSLQARDDETRLAWAVAREHLLLGIGPGVEFGVFFNEAHADGSYERVAQLFLHNQYLYLMIVGGLPALIAFLVFLLGSLRVALWGRVRGAATAATAACAVGLTMIAISAFVALYFSSDDMVACIALLAGVLQAARLEAESRHGRVAV